VLKTNYDCRNYLLKCCTRGCNTHHLHHFISKNKYIGTQKKLWINHKIRAHEVFLIDHNGNVHPNIATSEALQMAKEADLDLVEVNPTAEPPVCKIMDYGQYQYQQSRAAQEAKQKSKKTETKGLRLSFKIGSGDLLTRKKQAEKFLKKGNRVRIEMMLRGRERQHANLAIDKIKEFIASIETEVKIEQPVVKKGNSISAIINS